MKHAGSIAHHVSHQRSLLCRWCFAIGALAALVHASAALAQSKTIASNGHFGCTTKEQYTTLVGYAQAKDNEAFKKGIVAGLASGRCTTFRAGETVFLLDVSLLSGTAKVRQKGEVKEFFTSIEAIK